MSAKPDLETILEKQRRRYLLLLKVYELTDGDEQEIVMLESPEGLDENEVMTIVNYLAGEGLVQKLSDEAPLLRISHFGVVEVEQSLLNPKEPTEHFAATVIQNFHGNVGAIQTGNGAVANVTQNIGDPAVAELLKQLRQHLTDNAEANELVDGLEIEARQPTHSKSRVNLYLKSLAGFVRDTGKDLLVQIGTKLVTDQIGVPPKS